MNNDQNQEKSFKNPSLLSPFRGLHYRLTVAFIAWLIKGTLSQTQDRSPGKFSVELVSG